MIDENYFPFALNSYEESYQEDAFCQIFNPVLEPLDIKDEINPDKVYFLNGKDDSNNRNKIIIMKISTNFIKNLQKLKNKTKKERIIFMPIPIMKNLPFVLI